MSKKRIVLFSTREIGLPNGLFKKLDSRDWFRSTELCSFFLDNLDDNLKGKVLTQFGVDPSRIREVKKLFLEKYGIEKDVSTDESLLMADVMSLNIDNAFEEFENIWGHGDAMLLREGLEKFLYVQDDKSGMAKQKINIDCDIQGPYLYYRFSIYKLVGESNGPQDFVYAVWPLITKHDKKEEWYDALSAEILSTIPEEQDECLEIFLVLHNKDVYEKHTFDIVKSGENKILNGREFKLYVLVFQHQVGEDPIADILHSENLEYTDVVDKICKLSKLGSLKEISKLCSSRTPDTTLFEEKRKEFDSLSNSEVDAIQTISDINKELRSILNSQEEKYK